MQLLTIRSLYVSTLILLSTLLFVVVVTLALPNLVSAQGIALMIQPPTVQETLDPGDVAEGSIRITNENGGVQTYFISTRNISGMTDQGRPEFLDVDSDDAFRAAAWITPLVTQVTLGESESAEIPYRIDVPADAGPGSYFASIFVTREADVTTESGAGVGFHVASIFIIRIRGDAIEDMMFREFSTARLVHTEPEVEFTVRVENTGNVYERPRAIITITDMLGRKVDSFIMNEDGGGVMPRTVRSYSSTWSHEGFLLGRFSANASVAHGESSGKTITRDITFWVFPVKEVSYTLGALVALLLVLLLSVRAYVRRALKRAGVTGKGNAKAQAASSLGKKLMRTIGYIMAVIAILFIVMIVLNA
jgi:hypothetical protein